MREATRAWRDSCCTALRHPAEVDTQQDQLSKVEIILGAERLAQIQDAIADVGVGGMTVSEVGGIGRGSAGRRKARFKRGFAVQLKIEIVLETGRVPSLIDQILRTSRTPVGDGKILIHPIDNAIQIRTNRRGYDAV